MAVAVVGHLQYVLGPVLVVLPQQDVRFIHHEEPTVLQCETLRGAGVAAHSTPPGRVPVAIKVPSLAMDLPFSSQSTARVT